MAGGLSGRDRQRALRRHGRCQWPAVAQAVQAPARASRRAGARGHAAVAVLHRLSPRAAPVCPRLHAPPPFLGRAFASACATLARRRRARAGARAHVAFAVLVWRAAGLWTGAGAWLQNAFPPCALATLQAGAAPLVAVPSQLVLMLQYAERRRLAPIAGVELVLISGARWLRERTPALRRLFPRARIVEFYGASEASYIAWMDADPAAPSGRGPAFSNVDLHAGEHPGAGPAPGQPGLIWVRSPHAVHGLREPGRRLRAARGRLAVGARHGPSGRIRPLAPVRAREPHAGHPGQNLFPEEVGSACWPPAVAQASLRGAFDELRGSSVHAVLQWQGDAPAGLAARRLVPRGAGALKPAPLVAVEGRLAADRQRQDRPWGHSRALADTPVGASPCWSLAVNAMPIWPGARTPVAPVGGALAACRPHELAAPLVAPWPTQGLPASAVDAVVLGNALGAGGSPARVLALAAGLSAHTRHHAGRITAPAPGRHHPCLRPAGPGPGDGDRRWLEGLEPRAAAPAPARADGRGPVTYEQPPFTPWPAARPRHAADRA